MQKILALRPMAWWALFIAAVLTAPLWANDSLILLLVLAGLYGITAVGLDMLIGYAGQISFGQAGFIAMGAYGSALLSMNTDLAPWLTIPLAAIIVALCAWVMGAIILRLKGHYLAMATFAFGQVVFLLVGTLEVTGGASGLYGIPPLSLFGTDIVTPTQAFFLAWLIFAVCLFAALRIKDSRVGRALLALRYDETAASACGVNVHLMKTHVFALSALMAGIAGGIFAHYFSVVSADSFTVHLSILVMAIVVVGGMGTAWGTVIGTLLLTVVPGLLLTSTRYNGLLYGVIYIAVFLLFPQGIAGALTQFRDSARASPKKGDAAPSAPVASGQP
ncbi:branched-chain amino acid transport system permease protein [Rhodoligotrophos appendicifer]|uniref:branched-chain amino acid ABC transporter permease n=1 Tax=Rhodoligotrophos appendicifer TaxID=987056 RepID=UPI00118593C8|nr:branched-chain amino acid ABC transporter permease [Rhodoligotrophos appendicifer]